MKRLLVFLCAMLLTLGITGISQANLLFNGDAENGDLFGWDHGSTDYGDFIGAVGFQDQFTGTVHPFEGHYFFSFAIAPAGSGNTIWMGQGGSLSGIDVPLVLSGWVQTETLDDFSDVGIATLAFADQGSNVLTFASTGPLITGNSEWVFFDISLEIPDEASYWGVVLQGTVNANSDDNYANVFWDNVQLNPVPEPGTMLLLAAGLLGIAGFGRKKFFKR